jgi:hypothetical protein
VCELRIRTVAGPPREINGLKTPEFERNLHLFDHRGKERFSPHRFGGFGLHPRRRHRSLRPQDDHALRSVERFLDHFVELSSGRYRSIPPDGPALLRQHLREKPCTFAIGARIADKYVAQILTSRVTGRRPLNLRRAAASAIVTQCCNA